MRLTRTLPAVAVLLLVVSGCGSDPSGPSSADGLRARQGLNTMGAGHAASAAPGMIGSGNVSGGDGGNMTAGGSTMSIADSVSTLRGGNFFGSGT